MIDFGYTLRPIQVKALQSCAKLTEDTVPKITDPLNFEGERGGFRVLPQIHFKPEYGGREIMAHLEAGYWMSKMCVNPERSYDDVLERTMLLKHAEDQSGKGRFIVVDDFLICELIRFYAQFRGRVKVKPETWDKVKQMLVKSQYAPYHEPMSENHKICYLSSELIAAELFPDEPFYDGLTGRERLPLVKRSIRMFLDKRFRQGFSEFDSGSYYEIDIISLLNIHDFSSDKELKKMASDSIHTALAGMFHHSVNGYPGGPKGRVYANVLEDARCGMYNYVKVLGCIDDSEPDSHLATGVIFCACSPFLLDQVVYKLCFGKKDADYEVLESNSLYTIPDDLNVKGRIKKYFYVGKNYVLGSIVQRDNPHENAAYSWLNGHQENSWSLALSADSQATLFSSHPGNETLPDYGMHGFWTGDVNCLCARYAQYKNTLLGYYDITDPKQLPYIHFYIPKQHFDEILYLDRAICLRSGDVCMRLSFTGPYFESVSGAYAGREIILPATRCGFALEVFENKNCQELSHRKTLLNLTEHGICCRTPEDLSLIIEDGKTKINGQDADFNHYPLYASPYVSSKYNSGQIKVQYQGEEKIYGVSTGKE